MKFFTRKSLLRKIFYSILAVWFLLCILPGDCLLLGCTEEGTSHCNEEPSVVSSSDNDHTAAPGNASHCSTCCVLCAHNLILYTSHYHSNTHMDLIGNCAFIPTNRFNAIFQTIIFRPPRTIAEPF